MKKNSFIVFFAVLVIAVLVAIIIFFIYNQPTSWQTENLSLISDSQIISILKTSSDVQEYIKSHPDFKIDKKEILTKEGIITGSNGVNFREAYSGLSPEDGRYMRVDLTNQAGDRGMIIMIDFKKNEVVFSALLLLFAQNEEQQTTSPTENQETP
jgi:hypothetical protein